MPMLDPTQRQQQMGQFLNNTFGVLGFPPAAAPATPMPTYQYGMLGRNDRSYRASDSKNVAKTYMTKLGEDVPTSAAQLAINGLVPPASMTGDVAMAYAGSPGQGVPLPRPRPYGAPTIMDAAAMRADAAKTATAAPAKVAALGTPIGQPSLFGGTKIGGLLGLLFGNGSVNATADGKAANNGGLIGMLTSSKPSKSVSTSRPRITGPGGGGAYTAVPGSFGESLAGPGSLLPASMNNSRWM